MFLLSLVVSGVAGLWLVQSLLWYGAVGALIRLAWKVLHWWHEVLIVTDKRFMINSGIIETKNSMMPITKVTDMSYLRPFLGRYSVTVRCGWSQRDRSRTWRRSSICPSLRRCSWRSPNWSLAIRSNTVPICCNHLGFPAAVAAGLAGDPMTHSVIIENWITSRSSTPRPGSAPTSPVPSRPTNFCIDETTQNNGERVLGRRC